MNVATIKELLKDVDATIDKSIEEHLTELNGELMLSSGMVIGVEGLLADFNITPSNIASKLVSIGKNLYSFSKTVKEVTVNQIVSEKYLTDKFSNVLNAIQNISTSRAYVQNVPTFEEQRKRFLAIIKTVGYIEKAANSHINNLPYGDGFLDGIVSNCGGVVKLVKASEGSSFKNLKWFPPSLTEYEIKSSPWASASNMNQIKALAITCKYDMTEKLSKAADVLVKRCEEARDDLQNEGHDDSYSDNNEVANIYTMAYMVGKAIRQLHRDGIQNEVNKFAVTYLGRLKNFKYT